MPESIKVSAPDAEFRRKRLPYEGKFALSRWQYLQQREPAAGGDS